MAEMYLICNSICEMCFTIAFRVTRDFSDAERSFCADHPSANVSFPRTAVGKLCGLSIEDACQCEQHGLVAEVKTRSSLLNSV